MKYFLSFILTAAIIFLVGYFIPSFYLMSCGVIIAVGTILYGVTYLITKDEMKAENVNGIVICLILIYSIVYCCWHSDRYITANGSKQHLYADCSCLAKSSDVKKVTETQGFLYLTFGDCKVCENRKAKKKLEKRISNLKEDIQDEINRLQSLLDKLENGASVSSIENQFYCDDEEDDYYINEHRYK